jgi:membrane fusion protein (multidrug efflux system)
MSTETTQAPPLPLETKSPRQHRSKRLVLMVIVPAIVLLIAGLIYLHGGRYIETENAYVKADKIPVSADVAGPVKEVLVHENEMVSAGQILFRIDPASFQVAVDKAEAKLAQVRTDLAALKAGYREKQAEITQARTKHSFALKDQTRQADLVEKHFISASKFDDAKQTADLSAQQTETLQQDLKRIAETLGGSVDTPIETHPGYRSAMAELEQAKLDLARTEIRAALPGTVSKPPKPGQYVSVGSTAMAIVVAGNLWVEANFTETDLTYVHPGQIVVVHVDTFPDAVWAGVVDSLSPATGAEFSVIPAQNATGNWVKIAQRVPVRIRLQDEEGKPTLRAGSSATVEIDTGHRRRVLGFSF